MYQDASFVKKESSIQVIPLPLTCAVTPREMEVILERLQPRQLFLPHHWGPHLSSLQHPSYHWLSYNEPFLMPVLDHTPYRKAHIRMSVSGLR